MKIDERVTKNDSYTEGYMLENIIPRLSDSQKVAFVIKDTSYSYQELGSFVKKCYRFLESNPNIKLIGIVMNNDLDTYAMIIATFLSECGYVIINLAHPIERNTIIANEASLSYIFSSVKSDDVKVPKEFIFLYPGDFADSTTTVILKKQNPDSTAYILFTSGSTGNPKGVKITKRNLNAFLTSLDATPIAVREDDHVLQLYDLTFDASILMLLPALCKGATIYTASSSKVKLMDVARILVTYPISYVFLVPSIISLLRAYISDIYIPTLRMLLLGGEPVAKTLLEMIKPSVPNAAIWNFYGPTEGTVGVLIGKIGNVCDKDLYNGIIPIGKPMPGVRVLIMNDGEIISETGKKGELLIGGDQVTVGYVNDERKNLISFRYVDYDGKSERFYATGDLVCMNNNGEYRYCGRIDHQVKIQGYRIELSEIEFYAAQSAKTRAVAIVNNVAGNQKLYLFLENYPGDTSNVTLYLEKKLPPFMVPKDIIILKQFPISSNGKIDRMKMLNGILEF